MRASKLILGALATLLIAGRAHSEGYRLAEFSVSNVATTTVETVDSKTVVSGKPLAFVFLGATNMTVSVRTVAGIGISAVSREIVAATNDVYFYRVLPEAAIQYLYNEKVEMVVHSAPAGETNAANLTATGKLLVEAP